MATAAGQFLPASASASAAATSRFHNDTGSWLVVLVYCAHVLPKHSTPQQQHTQDHWTEAVAGRLRTLEEILEDSSELRTSPALASQDSSADHPFFSPLSEQGFLSRLLRNRNSQPLLDPFPSAPLHRPDPYSLLTLRKTLTRIETRKNSSRVPPAHSVFSLLPHHHVQCLNTIAQAFSRESQGRSPLSVYKRQGQTPISSYDKRTHGLVQHYNRPAVSHREGTLSSRRKHKSQRGKQLKLVDKRILRRYDNRWKVRPYDKKVFVYGKDDRLRIYPPLLRKFPYSNIVRLSTGCTGTLVTPFHVITAAHCVHNGSDFRDNLEMLKVEIPDTMVVRVYYIEKILIPGQWLSARGFLEQQAGWDFAVVRLSYGVHGRSQFSPLAVPTAAVLRQNLQFLGFPNHGHGLWRSICPAKSNKAVLEGNLILTRCDSAVGNSGAAVLTDGSRREASKIIGVLSNTTPVGRMPFYARYIVIAALTWDKLYDICAEIGPIGVAYSVCPPLSSIPRPRRQSVHNNVIPFFG